MEKTPEKEYFCINKAGVLPALFRCYLNRSSSFLRLTKSKMPLVAICKMTSNLLFVDFDIPTSSRILQPAFFLTSLNGPINKKGQTEFDLPFCSIYCIVIIAYHGRRRLPASCSRSAVVCRSPARPSRHRHRNRNWRCRS